MSNNKHEHYYFLNLLGYGLAKFDNKFIKQFGYKTKKSFYEYIQSLDIVETASVVKNRMDLFDPFFDNNRKGWWQKGNTYIHRKHLIDSLFGTEDVVGFANIVKLYMQENFDVKTVHSQVKPILISRFQKLQETGLEAELYFMQNYQDIDSFKEGTLEDARLYGDGYDFQIDVGSKSLLAEIKGVRTDKGRFRLTEKEYIKAQEYKHDYIITLVMNLNERPRFLVIENPIKNLSFQEKVISSKITKEYHLTNDIC